jgi:hypothetical protein
MKTAKRLSHGDSTGYAISGGVTTGIVTTSNGANVGEHEKDAGVSAVTTRSKKAPESSRSLRLRSETRLGITS